MIDTGNSRVYVYRGGTLIQLKRDRVLARWLVSKNLLGKEEVHAFVESGKQTNWVMRGGEEVALTHFRRAEKSDIVILCSSNLVDGLGEDQVESILKRSIMATQAEVALRTTYAETQAQSDVRVTVYSEGPWNPSASQPTANPLGPRTRTTFPRQGRIIIGLILIIVSFAWILTQLSSSPSDNMKQGSAAGSETRDQSSQADGKDSTQFGDSF